MGGAWPGAGNASYIIPVPREKIGRLLDSSARGGYRVHGVTLRKDDLVKKVFPRSWKRLVRRRSNRVRKPAEMSNDKMANPGNNPEPFDDDLEGIDLTLGPDEVEMDPEELEDFRKEAEVTFFALLPGEADPPQPKPGEAGRSKDGQNPQTGQKPQQRPAARKSLTIEDLLTQLDQRRKEDKEELQKARAEDKAEAERNYKSLRSEAAKNVRELTRTIVGNHSEISLRIAAAASATDAKIKAIEKKVLALEAERAKAKGKRERAEGDGEEEDLIPAKTPRRDPSTRSESSISDMGFERKPASPSQDLFKTAALGEDLTSTRAQEAEGGMADMEVEVSGPGYDDDGHHREVVVRRKDVSLPVKSSKKWDPEVIKYVNKNGSVDLVAYRKAKAKRDVNDNITPVAGPSKEAHWSDDEAEADTKAASLAADEALAKELAAKEGTIDDQSKALERSQAGKNRSTFAGIYNLNATRMDVPDPELGDIIGKFDKPRPLQLRSPALTRNTSWKSRIFREDRGPRPVVPQDLIDPMEFDRARRTMTVRPVEVVFTEGREDKAALVARLINAIAKASKRKTAKEVQEALQEGVLNIWREVPQGSRPARGHPVCIRVQNDDALQRLINLKASLGDDRLTMAQAFPRYAWRLSTWLRAREVAFRKYHQERKMKGYKARVGLDEETYLPVLKLTYPDERRPIIYADND